jgi:ribosome maturation factor RimP
MLTINELRPIVEAALATQDAFLVDMNVSGDGRIQVYADLHEGHISIQALKMINRAVENALGEDSENYGIEVSSPGMFNPFRVESQYRKAIGRTVKVSCQGGRVEHGTLESFDGEKLVLVRTVRVPKTIGKGKMDLEERVELPLAETVETVLEFKF